MACSGSRSIPTSRRISSCNVGDYFFADFCAGWIKRRDVTGTISDFASGISLPVDLQVTPDGSLYYLARGNGGQVYRIDYTANQAPNITDQPDDVSVALGQSATFSVAATGNPAPMYQWQRNQVNIAGATSSSFSIPAVTADDHNDLFRVVVSNSLGTVFSREALLTVKG